MIHLTINLEALNGLALAMQEHTKKFEALDEAGAELTRRFGGWAGPSAEKALAEERAKIEAQREVARQSMRELVASAKSAFIADIDRQTMLAGAQIDVQDAELLQGALVNDPDELASVQARHTENPTMRRLIARYASERGWNGFSDETNAAAARTFGDTFFKMAEHGATEPHGYGGMSIANFANVEQLLSAYGL
jgi:hypothetical protein